MKKILKIIHMLFFLIILSFLTSCQTTNQLTIELNKPITLQQNQTATVKDKNIEITVASITYSPCPEYARCIWSGVAAEFLVVNNDEQEQFTLQEGSQKEVFGITLRLTKVTKEIVTILVY